MDSPTRDELDLADLAERLARQAGEWRERSKAMRTEADSFDTQADRAEAAAKDLTS